VYSDNMAISFGRIGSISLVCARPAWLAGRACDADPETRLLLIGEVPLRLAIEQHRAVLLGS